MLKSALSAGLSKDHSRNESSLKFSDPKPSISSTDLVIALHGSAIGPRRALCTYLTPRSPTTMGQSAAIRRIVPWEVVDAALWPSSSGKDGGS